MSEGSSSHSHALLAQCSLLSRTTGHVHMRLQKSRVTRGHARDRSPADLYHLVGAWPRSLTPDTQLYGYTLFLEETAEPRGQQRARKATARLSTNRALREWGAH